MWKARFRNVIIPKEGSLPPHLFFQMDNSYQESKNKYILGFCVILVEKSIFKEVIVQEKRKNNRAGGTQRKRQRKES
ncbi:uncharacterized protein LOC122963416 isoform X2 [Acropora millepora]|uniref:uncharacterized protein LOC122963416 isoform X2 n=1 Tax=Acropora millepora TaxID=45264 RepID=UPI001CF481BF|nr:uncharacterized protein LOC122963416 isoform X2 [Acropora millepora]